MSEPRPGSVERVIDAGANRAREALRVAEDFARFVVADGELAGRLREMRHRVTELISRLAPDRGLLAERDTEGDLGASPERFRPAARTTSEDVAASAFKRAEEALRSLAEFSKLAGATGEEVSAGFERERYALYDLEKRALVSHAARRKVERVRLCVVLASEDASMPLADAAGAVLKGGARMLQLQRSQLPDAQFLKLAREIGRLAAAGGALFVVSGRPDLARLADADGVYLKPGDLPVGEARRVLGPAGVVGCSALSVDEARAAERDGATYVVYGPVFTSPGDGPDEGGGLDLVSSMNSPDSQPGIPCFAFGGITTGNLDAVIEAGARRVAVSAAVIGSDDPAAAARELSEKLETAAGV